MKRLIVLTLIGVLGFSSISLAARDEQSGDCIRKGNCKDIKLAPVNVPDCIKSNKCRDTNDQG